MADTGSSRIFIKGLPPTLTDAEFRKHFSQNGREITDAKIFQTRRIGYIGYKTPEDAQKAVKYFNKTFMRMSRIGIEIARPAQAGNEQQSSHVPTARRSSAEKAPAAGMKRKRDSEPAERTEDPKLKEFMDVMRPKSKKKAWENEGLDLQAQEQKGQSTDAVMYEDGQSDEEYEEVPRKKQQSRSEPEVESAADTKHAAVEDNNVLRAAEEGNDEAEAQVQGAGEGPSKPATSDADWARSKTSRLLGLLDDEEEAAEEAAEDDPESEEEATEKGAVRPKPETSIPTPPSEEQLDDNEPANASNPDVEAVRSSMRLFVRNLPYDVKEEDLESDFAPYGNLEEVCLRSLRFSFCKMNT